MKVEELFQDGIEDEQISAFAFNTGRLIEHIVNTMNDNLKEENDTMRGRIMSFRLKIWDKGLREAYDRHFGINIIAGFKEEV